MKACAIIAEYNPFHNGHAWHIQQTKKQRHSDVLIAIMSGNYVQRGELAIIDKWQRAEEALKQGLDLVVELPTMSAVQSADYFAQQAVKHVRALQCQHLSFGVEQPDDQLLFQIAENVRHLENNRDYTLAYHDYVRQQVQEQLGEAAAQFVETPNNQLALSYVKALKTQGAEVSVVLTPRKGACHTDKLLATGKIASGTAIRHALSQQQTIASYVSLQMATNLQSATPLLAQLSWWQVLKVKLLTLPLETLQGIYQVDEGMEYRLKAAARQAQTYEAFLDKATTKRFKRARIQRICVYIMLQITKEQMDNYLKTPVNQVRILGFTPRGLAYLKTLTDVEWITQFKQHHHKQWGLQMDYDVVYTTLTQCQTEQNFRRVVRV